VFVLGLDTLAAAFSEELLQYSWPHCGKIGRYVSHRARSLTGPTNVWFAGRIGFATRSAGAATGPRRVNGGRRERIDSPVTVVSAARTVQVVVPSLWTVSPRAAGLTRRRRRAYRNQVELSMAAAACLRWAQITRSAPHQGTCADRERCTRA
jgi:hypothetical protein